MYNEVGQPELLLDKHWEDLSDDLERKLQREHQNPELMLSVDQRKNICLYELGLIMHKNGQSLKDYYPMPLPSSDMLLQLRNHLIREQLDYDISIEAENVQMMLPSSFILW